MKYLKCTECGWVHFGRTFSEVIEELIRFAKYYYSLTRKDQKEMYGGRCSSITDYMYCHRCDAIFTKMRKAKKSEIPLGSTLQPILIEEKKNGKQRVRRTKRKTNKSV